MQWWQIARMGCRRELLLGTLTHEVDLSRTMRNGKPDGAAETAPELLPIHELLALDAVSRLGSVQAAADALHVTPSGISHRIASLELRLHATLLERKGRGVALTAEGTAYVRAVRQGLDELGSATEALRRGENEVVRIATAAAIGAAWLLPVLKRRSVEMPSAARIELLTVATSDELPSDRWDILVHYGRSPRRGSHRRVLFTDRLVAVCAPRDDASKRSENTGDRVEIPTLRLSQLGASERDFGLGASSQSRGQLIFDDAVAMLEVASTGTGIAISTTSAAKPYLDSGRLVLATDTTQAGERYFADLSESGRLKPDATSLFLWLVQVAKTAEQAP